MGRVGDDVTLGKLLALVVVIVALCLFFFSVGRASAQLINGTDADDYLVGTPNDDTMYGKDGKDELHARDGNDLLSGGRGNDLLEGQGGRDTMQGGRGNDVLYAWGGTSGIDTLSCGAGRDDWAYVGSLDIVTSDSGCEHVQVLP